MSLMFILWTSIILKSKIISAKIIPILIPSNQPFFKEFLPIINPPKAREKIGIIKFMMLNILLFKISK